MSTDGAQHDKRKPMLVLAGLMCVLRDPVRTIKWMIVFMIIMLLVVALKSHHFMCWLCFWAAEFFYMIIWFIESSRGKTLREVFTTWGSKPGFDNVLEA